MSYTYSTYEDASTRTDQDEQHQELYCRGRERVDALEENYVHPALLDVRLSPYHTKIYVIKSTAFEALALSNHCVVPKLCISLDIIWVRLLCSESMSESRPTT